MVHIHTSSPHVCVCARAQVESTLALQSLQPRVKELQAKYAGDQERLQVGGVCVKERGVVVVVVVVELGPEAGAVYVPVYVPLKALLHSELFMRDEEERASKYGLLHF